MVSIILQAIDHTQHYKRKFKSQIKLCDKLCDIIFESIHGGAIRVSLESVQKCSVKFGMFTVQCNAAK